MRVGNLLVFMLLSYLDGVWSQLDCATCVETAPPGLNEGETLSCYEQKELGKCERKWMEGYCQCTCGGCDVVGNANIVVDGGVDRVDNAEVAMQNDEAGESPVISSPSVAELLALLARFPDAGSSQSTPQEPCDCYDEPPTASTKTCEEMFTDGECDVMLRYGFCECTCGKCTLEQQSLADNEVDGQVEENAVTVSDEQKQVDDDLTTTNQDDLSLSQQDDMLLDLVRTATNGLAQPDPSPLPTPLSQVASRAVEQPQPLVQVASPSVQVATTDPSPEPSVQPQPSPMRDPSLPCEDIAPPETQFSCLEWKQQNKCARKWMEGYCERTCGVCGDLVEQTVTQPALLSETAPLPVPAPSSTGTYQDMCKSTCNDNPPPQSDYSCERQLAMGKCVRDWMSGYCECTCGTCDALQDFSGTAEQKSVWNPDIAVAVPQQLVPVPTTAPAPMPQASSGQSDLVLTILHFNDIHARVMPVTEWWWECEPWRNDKGECHGGFARIKTIVDQHNHLRPNLLVLNGGDDFVGTDWDYHDPTNKATSHFLNIIGVDAMAIGNHEFDHGPDTLATFARNTNYPLLSCNMDASKQPNLQSVTQKYTIKEVQGKKIGIFGLTTTFTNTAKHADTRGVWFSDPNSSARQCVLELKSQGVEIIIALSHLGYSADKFLAKQVDGIDLVVGSHSHTFLEPNGGQGPVLNFDNGNRDTAWGKYPTWIWSDYGRRVPVVQAGWATRYLGKLTLEFDNRGEVVDAYGNAILLGGSKSGNNVQEDQQMKQELEQWKWW